MKSGIKYIISMLLLILFLTSLPLFFKWVSTSNKPSITLINELPKSVIIKEISKRYAGLGSYDNNVNSMLIIDGDNKLHFLTYSEFNLYPFFNYEKK